MFDLEREKPIALADATKVIPAINAVPGMEPRKPLNPRTVFNWATRGKRGVILESTSVGGILVTSREALHRFFARVTEARTLRMALRNVPIRVARQRVNANYAAVRARLRKDHGI